MPSNTFKAVACGLVAGLISPAAAFWRMPCGGRLSIERVDPIVNPEVVSGHVHTVSGGSGFGFNTTYDQQRESACSSCPIKADLSAYWTPKMYFQGPNGFQDVPQAGEGDGRTGGMTVYYEQRYNSQSDLKVQAFPKDFRMLAGNPFQRNDTGLQAAPGNAVSYVCLDYYGPTHPQTTVMPDINCPDGLRAQIYFPSCNDGRTDSADHKSHMAYPIGHYDNGPCPDTHPIRLISIFYEIIYQTNLFADQWKQNQGTQPFVFANGDSVGYGFHGDFVNGWDVDVLQSAVDVCTSNSGLMSDCKYFADPSSLYTDSEMQACRLPPQIDEPVLGNLTKLPGCNPVTGLNEIAAPAASCPGASIGPAIYDFTDVTTTLGWSYQGCANDDVSARTLMGASSAGGTMTVESCINFCKGKGYSLAGLEYATQCYCDNKYSNPAMAPRKNFLGNCMSPCAGNPKQMCGGAGALSMYKTCNGGSCVNEGLIQINGTFSTMGSVSAGASIGMNVTAGASVGSMTAGVALGASSAGVALGSATVAVSM